MKKNIIALCLFALAGCGGDPKFSPTSVDCEADPAPIDTWEDGTTVTMYNARLRVHGQPDLVAELYNDDGSVYVGVGRVYLEDGMARVSCGAEFKATDGTRLDYPAAYAVFSEKGAE